MIQNTTPHFKRPSTQYLNLSNTGIIDVDIFPALNQLLRESKTLEYLNISQNVIFTNIIRLARHTFEVLQHNSTLVHLDLGNTGLQTTKNTAEALKNLLQVNKTLRFLNLSNNGGFLDSGARCIFQGLQHNATLLHLDLRNTGITDKGGAYIAQVLISNYSIQTLLVSQMYNRISNRMERALSILAQSTGKQCYTDEEREDIVKRSEPSL